MKLHLALMTTTLIVFSACDSSPAGAAKPGATSDTPTDEASGESQAGAPQRRITVAVSASGYEPSTLEAPAGKPLTLVFRRTTEKGCGQEVVFPQHDIRRKLPLNEDVEIVLTPKVNERIAFTCGMGMFRGSVVAVAH